MSWLEKILPTITSAVKKNIPEGLWSKCPSCDATLYEEELKNKFYVCPSCDHHMRINAQTRLEMFLDEGSLVEVAENVETEDPLKFKDQKKYKDRISAAQKATNQKEAIVVRQGTLKGMNVVAAAFEFKFQGRLHGFSSWGKICSSS